MKGMFVNYHSLVFWGFLFFLSFLLSFAIRFLWPVFSSSRRISFCFQVFLFYFTNLFSHTAILYKSIGIQSIQSGMKRLWVRSDSMSEGYGACMHTGHNNNSNNKICAGVCVCVCVCVCCVCVFCVFCVFVGRREFGQIDTDVPRPHMPVQKQPHRQCVCVMHQ